MLICSATDGSIATRIEAVLAEGIAVDAMGNVYAGEVQGRMLKKFAKH